MHKAALEVMDLAEKLDEANRTIEGFEAQKSMDIEKAKAEIKKEMEKALIESDIKREVAIARLETYERMVNKDDFNKEIREMLKSAIQGLSAKPSGNVQQQKGGGGGQPQT